MTDIKAADLPEGSIVVEQDGDQMVAGETEIHDGVRMRWRNEHVVASDKFVSWMLEAGARVLRHGYGDEGES
ncbi:MAG: hypothetical protein ABW022_14900 [Actinoplanes sp.]